MDEAVAEGHFRSESAGDAVANVGGAWAITPAEPQEYNAGQGAASMIQALLVDDHQVVRAGLAMLLDAADDIAVVAQAADGDEAIETYKQYGPDVVLMDLAADDGWS